MNIRTLIPLALLTAATGSTLALAEPGHDEKPAATNMQMEMADTDMHVEMPGSHAHDSWVEAPAEYRGTVSTLWKSMEAADRGAVIYQNQCAACHGDTGRGDGPMAANLEHKPADLTSNFHQPGQSGDDYLFWRISEGGMVAPFKGTGSSMPAFKFALDDQQRWDVLSYLHQAFHVVGMSDEAEGHVDEDNHG